MTYEYRCKSCGHEWEQQQKISEQAIRECPRCKKETAQRLISGGTGTIFRGAGWYATGGY